MIIFNEENAETEIEINPEDLNKIRLYVKPFILSYSYFPQF